MATLGGALTYNEVIKRMDPNGTMAKIVPLLSQTNEILLDAIHKEGNLPMGHQATVQTGLPEGAWRMYNRGVPEGNASTAQIMATCGMLEAISKVDCAIAELNGNSAAFRLEEDGMKMEGLNQQMAEALIYSNSAALPNQFTGFMPHYSTLDPSVGSSRNVIDAGGTGSKNTSIILVTWDDRSTFCIYPKGSSVGLSHQDLGKDVVSDSTGAEYLAYRSYFKWHSGLFVRDWRYNARICNIDVDRLGTPSGADLLTLMTWMVNKLPTAPRNVGNTQTINNGEGISTGRSVIYCNRTVKTHLELQSLNKNNLLLNYSEIQGAPVLTFRGIPIRTVDKIAPFPVETASSTANAIAAQGLTVSDGMAYETRVV